MRCIACDNPISHKKRRPVTLASGQMISEYTDFVYEFPRHEDEDLCTKCINSIRDYSSDQNDQLQIENNFTWTRDVRFGERDEEVIDAYDRDDYDVCHLARVTESVYEGRRDNY